MVKQEMNLCFTALVNSYSSLKLRMLLQKNFKKVGEIEEPSAETEKSSYARIRIQGCDYGRTEVVGREDATDVQRVAVLIQLFCNFGQ